MLKLDRKLENQENGCMKTTLELPDALVKQIKLRAVRRGQKLKDAIAELLRKGLNAANEPGPDDEGPAIRVDQSTGLPVIQCNRSASRDDEMTPERVANILLAQEVGWHDEASR
jgi:plasmid stability protein